MPLMKFHMATAVSCWFRRLTNAYNTRLLRQIKEAEVCPHVEVIPASSERVSRLTAHVARHGGIAFATESQQRYFWHPNSQFIPITATAVFDADAGWKPPLPTGELCRLCGLCEKARPKYPDV